MARSIAEAVARAGGRTYYVGGYVRDSLRGVANKDIDIEVHGIAPDALRSILDSIGECTVMGASFGIYGLRGCGLDIAMPRRERATGRGHRDFAVFVDPFIGTRGAALRRDFTINAMMRDVLSGELIDHFGGAEDLRRGVLRHVNDESFVEDPLRVLRAAQFAARFGFSVAEESVTLCRRMDLSALTRERILGELQKALLKADAPAIFFETLREMGQLGHWFPELEALIGVPLDPRDHPEGDVWAHTMGVLNAAAGLLGEAQHPLGYMLSALLHDVGKPGTTRVIDGRIRAPGHDAFGEATARQLLQRLTNEEKLIRYTLNMVRLHMQPNRLAAQHASDGEMALLYDGAICPEDLILLAKADRLGRGDALPYAETERFLREQLENYRSRMAQPGVTGADLIAAGMRPGRAMGEALRYAHTLHLSGIPKEEALLQTLDYAHALKS